MRKSRHLNHCHRILYALLAPALAGCWTATTLSRHDACRLSRVSPVVIASEDWSGLFRLSTKTGAEVRGTLLASLSVTRLSKEIDLLLTRSCNDLARGLGGGGGNDAEAACKDASLVLDQSRRTMGLGAKVALDFSPVHCPLLADEIEICTQRCEALEIHGERAAIREGCKVSCEAQSLSKLECSPVRFDLRIDGATNAQAQARFENAIKNSLGDILKIAFGMNAPAGAIAGQAEKILYSTENRLRSEFKDSRERDNASACFSHSFSQMFAEIVNIKENLRLANKVANSLLASPVVEPEPPKPKIVPPVVESAPPHRRLIGPS